MTTDDRVAAFAEAQERILSEIEAGERYRRDFALAGLCTVGAVACAGGGGFAVLLAGAGLVGVLPWALCASIWALFAGVLARRGIERRKTLAEAIVELERLLGDGRLPTPP